ncbi:MAG: flagellar biosynthesis anti-sigma factor FlgM [Silvibacterium sp.]
MNISNDFQSLQPIPGETQVSGVEKASNISSAAPASAGGDEAHLSSAASLASHAASLPDVRMEKVQSVQAAIAGGGYNVSASDVAQSLMGHMLSNKE